MNERLTKCPLCRRLRPEHEDCDCGLEVSHDLGNHKLDSPDSAGSDRLLPADQGQEEEG